MASRRDNPSSVPVCSPLPQRPVLLRPPPPPPLAATMRNGRQSGLVFGAVFKTVRRLLKSLVCSIRTVFRHPRLNFPISRPPASRYLYAPSRCFTLTAKFMAILPTCFHYCENSRTLFWRYGSHIPLGTASVSIPTFHFSPSRPFSAVFGRSRPAAPLSRGRSFYGKCWAKYTPS
jgi:hypothetical protein